jgi:uncharacterized protein YceK
MKKPLLFLLITSVLASGCGTVCNLVGGVVHPDSEPKVYGGVARDLDIIEKGVTGTPTMGQGNAGKGAAVLVVGVLALAVVDPILSFAADTLTLPVTIPLQERRIALELKERIHDQSRALPEANGSGPGPTEATQKPAGAAEGPSAENGAKNLR